MTSAENYSYFKLWACKCRVSPWSNADKLTSVKMKWRSSEENCSWSRKELVELAGPDCSQSGCAQALLDQGCGPSRLSAAACLSLQLNCTLGTAASCFYLRCATVCPRIYFLWYVQVCLFVFFSCTWCACQTLLSPKVFCFSIVNNHSYVSLRSVGVEARGTFYLASETFPPSLLFVTQWNTFLLLIHAHSKDLPSLWL